MCRQCFLQVQIKCDETEHSDRDSNHSSQHSPYMCIPRRQRLFTVDTLDLRSCCYDRTGDSDKHVLEYTNPDYVKPGQATMWLGQFTAWPGPRLDLEGGEEILLTAKSRVDVVAQQREETSDCEGFVAVLCRFVSWEEQMTRKG